MTVRLFLLIIGMITRLIWVLVIWRAVFGPLEEMAVGCSMMQAILGQPEKPELVNDDS